MKFGHLFEFHKVPEWYAEYVDYNQLRALIDAFKTMCKEGGTRKLKGYYMVNNKGQLYCIDFIKNYKDEMNEQKSLDTGEGKHRTLGTELGNSKRRYQSAYKELNVEDQRRMSHNGELGGKSNSLDKKGLKLEQSSDSKNGTGRFESNEIGQVDSEYNVTGFLDNASDP